MDFRNGCDVLAGNLPKGSESVAAEGESSVLRSVASVEGSSGFPRLVVAAILLLAATLLALRVVARFDISWLFDDAYIFQRYAHNILTDHRVAWNPHGEPVYGSTSLLFLAAATPLQALCSGNTALAALLASALSGLAFLAVVAALARTHAAAAGATLVVVAYCVSASPTVEHFVSGMDTTFGLAFAAAYLLAALRLERLRSSRALTAVVILGGLTFFARPELLVYALSIPAGFAVLSRDEGLRKLGRVALAAIVAGLCISLALTWAYFGWPLPLPFLAKSSGLYGDAYAAIWSGQSSRDLLAFVRSYWPLFAIIALELVLGFRRYRETASITEQVTLVAMLALLLYSWLRVLPIMGFHQRFFQPLVPALVVLSAGAFARLATTSAPKVGRLTGGHLGALVALALFGASLLAALGAAAKDLDNAVATRAIGRVDLAEFARTAHSKYWFKLDRISTLPDSLVIASTEVGALGAMNPSKRIVDMSGLNEPEFARRGFDGDRFFELARPDLIYMPHPHYQAMIEELRHAKVFVAEYVAFGKEALRTRDFGVAIRKNGRHYAQLARIVGDSLLDEAFRLLNARQPMEARTLAEQVAELDSKSSRAAFLIGLSWAAQNDLPRAVEAYRRSVALDPQNAQAYNNLGFSLGVLSQRDAAVAALTEAVRLAPGDKLARNNLAWAQGLPTSPH